MTVIILKDDPSTPGFTTPTTVTEGQLAVLLGYLRDHLRALDDYSKHRRLAEHAAMYGIIEPGECSLVYRGSNDGNEGGSTT